MDKDMFIKVKKIPLNVCRGGHAALIRANYYKMSLANFVRQDGLCATGIMEIYEAEEKCIRSKSFEG